MDEAGRNKLWENYGKTKSPEIREKLILEYAPLVKLVAGRLSMYLGLCRNIRRSYRREPVFHRH